jgi:hypothetical protein
MHISKRTKGGRRVRTAVRRPRSISVCGLAFATESPPECDARSGRRSRHGRSTRGIARVFHARPAVPTPRHPLGATRGPQGATRRTKVATTVRVLHRGGAPFYFRTIHSSIWTHQPNGSGALSLGARTSIRLTPPVQLVVRCGEVPQSKRGEGRREAVAPARCSAVPRSGTELANCCG